MPRAPNTTTTVAKHGTNCRNNHNMRVNKIYLNMLPSKHGVCVCVSFSVFLLLFLSFTLLLTIAKHIITITVFTISSKSNVHGFQAQISKQNPSQSSNIIRWNETNRQTDKHMKRDRMCDMEIKMGGERMYRRMYDMEWSVFRW